MVNKMFKKNQNKYITLGNLAKISNISRDTLSFYVRRGLVKPVYIGENGYKYFLPEQVQTINFIRFYRKLDFNLETIQNMLDNSEEYTCETAFTQQQTYIRQKIEAFNAADKYLETEKAFLKLFSAHGNDSAFVEYLEEMNFYITPIQFCHSLNNAGNAIYMSDFFTRNNCFFIPEYPICCIIPRDTLLTENFCAYANSFKNNNIETEPTFSTPPLTNLMFTYEQAVIMPA
jgi:DNA-binding transcriptional MerR regulator